MISDELEDYADAVTSPWGEQLQALEAKARDGHGIVLNSALHAND